jgi:hypothetical protein
MEFSSANVAAKFFVITAIMPVRCHQEMKKRSISPQPGFADCRAQKPDQKRVPRIPNLDASNSQLQVSFRKILLNDIAL